MKIIENPDREFVEDMKRSIKKNNGYCPCRTTKTPETKCMCAEFKESIKNEEEGWCHCGLYYAEKKQP